MCSRCKGSICFCIFEEMKKVLYLILLISPLLLTHCGPDGLLKPKDPEPDTLPPITTEGLQTFGYKVNGEVVRYKFQSARYINLDHIPETGLLGLQMNTIEETCVLKHDSIKKTGLFTFNINKKNPDSGLNAHGGVSKKI